MAPHLIKYRSETSGIYFKLADIQKEIGYKKYHDKVINFLQAPVVIFFYSQVNNKI